MRSGQIAVCVLFCFFAVTHAGWMSDKPFEDALTAGVVFVSSGAMTTRLMMDENMPPASVIARMNFDDESGTLATPEVTSFEDGKNNSMLGVRAEKRGFEWYLVVQFPQDYEVPYQKSYVFYFDTGAPGLGNRVALVTRNLNDMPPVVTALEPLCVIEENKVISLAQSECTFSVHDEDGDVLKVTFDVPAPFRIAFLEVVSDMDAKVALLVDEPTGLDYERIPSLELTITAADEALNTFTTSRLVQVMDVADTPPVWSSSFVPQIITEEFPTTLRVKAFDGDLGINAEIAYKLDFPVPTDAQYFSMADPASGLIEVLAIDRDILTSDVFRFTVTAFEVQDEVSSTSATMVVKVTDINDNIPWISLDVAEVAIDEGSSQPLNFNLQVADPDLAEFGQFKIDLVDESGKNRNENFLLMPSVGYQHVQVTIAVKNASALDFENPLMRTMTLKLVATELSDPTRTSEQEVSIKLLNVNDEWPAFEQAGYAATLPEDAVNGTFVARVQAWDPDQGDIVIHSLTTPGSPLSIDPLTGEVTVAVDQAFDFELQPRLVVQVAATDAVGHVAYVLLVVDISDVDDYSPPIELGWGRL